MDNALVNRFSSDVTGYLSATPVFNQWHDARQILIMRLGEDEPWTHALPVISCQAVGGEPANAIPVAAAWITMYHAANLIDDLGDENLQLEGDALQPNESVMLALAWVFAAMQMLSEPGLDARARLRVLPLFSQAGFDSSLGQFQFMKRGVRQSENADPLYNYWSSTILKSGSIYRAGAAGGAAAGTDLEALIESLGDYGVALGVIRQVLDDCRDIWSDAADESKNSTLPLLLFALTSNQRAETVIRVKMPTERFANKLPVEKPQSITDAGIPEIIAEILLEWRRRALESLQVLNPSRAKESLVDILEHVLSSPWIIP